MEDETFDDIFVNYYSNYNNTPEELRRFMNFVELLRYTDEDVEFISKLLGAIIVRKYNDIKKPAVISNIYEGWGNKYWVSTPGNDFFECHINCAYAELCKKLNSEHILSEDGCDCRRGEFYYEIKEELYPVNELHELLFELNDIEDPTERTDMMRYLVELEYEKYKKKEERTN